MVKIKLEVQLNLPLRPPLALYIETTSVIGPFFMLINAYKETK
jgi:hypothetical protein